jgi:peptide-methionine (S)-S-oxide reductase
MGRHARRTLDVMWFKKNAEMVAPDDALPGRTDRTMQVPDVHFVNGHPLVGPWPDGFRTAVFGLGCFWGAEKMFWETPGVYSTAAGYAGGYTPNATYEEVCSGSTGHAEVVLVVYDPHQVSYGDLLRLFWEAHDPTQGFRQGNDVGSQYRSAIYTTDETDEKLALVSRDAYAERLGENGYGEVTTEIAPLADFYYAEPYHQQYLAKNPNGYCPIHSTGVACSIPT